MKMIKSIIQFIILLLSLSVILQAQQVEVSFVVTDGVGGELILKAGVDPSATDGLDAVLGESELPPLPPSGIFDARFVLPDPTDETVASLKDIRYGNITPSNEGYVTQHKLTSQLGSGSTALTICWDIDGVNLNFKDNVTGELFNKNVTTSGPGCFTVPLNLTTVIVTITYVKSPIPSELNLSPESLMLESNVDSYKDFVVSSNVNWSVSGSVSWLSLSPVSGSNDGTVRITATSTNPTINERNGTVTVVGGGLTKTVNVTQLGSSAELTLTPSNREVTSSSGSTTFDISSNVSWSLGDNASWLTVLPATGSGSVTLTASYSENILLTQRIATITATGGGITRTVTVTQAGATPVLTVSPTSLTLGSASGSNDKISVLSNVSWTVTDNASWLAVTPSSGSNNGELTVTATSENTSINSRNGIVTVTGNGITIAVTITQAGANPVLTISPDSILLEYNTGSFGDFSVSSNVDWTVKNSQEWLTVSPISGSNNGNIRATAITENQSTTETRIDTITVVGEGITQLVVVAQSPTVPSLVVSPDSVVLASEAGSHNNININSNINWSISENAEWLSVSPVDGFGDSIITVTATSANQSATVIRETIVTISGGNIAKTVKVSQFPSGAMLSVTPTSLELDYEEGSFGNISIISNIDWEIISDTTWINISPKSGSNNGMVKITTKSTNTSTNPRSTIISVIGNEVVRTLEVTQLGWIDTLPPAAPTGFIAEVLDLANGILLTWNKNIEDDLSYYTIYKANINGFEPDTTNILVRTNDTTFVDNEILEGSYYYKISATDYSGNESDFADASVIVGVDEKINLPAEYSLEQNYPNPFNPSTKISYSIKLSGEVNIMVYNFLGQKVATLIEGYKEPGKYSIIFNASDLPSGVYFYSIRTRNYFAIKKMMLLR